MHHSWACSSPSCSSKWLTSWFPPPPDPFSCKCRAIHGWHQSLMMPPLPQSLAINVTALSLRPSSAPESLRDISDPSAVLPTCYRFSCIIFSLSFNSEDFIVLYVLSSLTRRLLWHILWRAEGVISLTCTKPGFSPFPHLQYTCNVFWL